MTAPPNLPSLTPDERIWRLGWFGECGYPGHVRRYAQPSIRIALSPVSGDPSLSASSVGLERLHQHLVWAPISVLPMLAIGDLWHNGQRIESPQYQSARFSKLNITAETTAFVKAGLSIDDSFLLPLEQHPWHRPFTQSYCVAVTLDEHRRLLVPCMEIIRFYFGSSGNLLQGLFTAPLTPFPSSRSLTKQVNGRSAIRSKRCTTHCTASHIALVFLCAAIYDLSGLRVYRLHQH